MRRTSVPSAATGEALSGWVISFLPVVLRGALGEDAAFAADGGQEIAAVGAALELADDDRLGELLEGVGDDALVPDPDRLAFRLQLELAHGEVALDVGHGWDLVGDPMKLNR